MKNDARNNKLTLVECRKSVAKGEIQYTDEELLKMRNWLENIADMALEYLEKNGVDCLDELIKKTEIKSKGKLQNKLL